MFISRRRAFRSNIAGFFFFLFYYNDGREIGEILFNHLKRRGGSPRSPGTAAIVVSKFQDSRVPLSLHCWLCVRRPAS